MNPFSTLSAGIQVVLETLPIFAKVALVQEDAGNVPAQIEKEVGRLGMMALLGVPDFDNDDPLANQVNARIKLQILFIEAPSIWRKTANTPRCTDVAQAAAAELQGVQIQGFDPLRVLRGGAVVDKEAGPLQLYRLELETMQIFE